MKALESQPLHIARCKWYEMIVILISRVVYIVFQNVQGNHWMILELSMHEVKHHKHDLITLTYKTQQMIDILIHRQLTK